MNELQPIHFVIFGVILLVVILLNIVLFFVPMFRILRKMGYSGWWSMLVFAPFGSIIGLWMLAYSTWPLEEGRAPPAPPA